MAKHYMERIEALKTKFLNTRVEMDVENAKLLTEGFREYESMPWVLKKANGFRNQCRKKTIFVQEHELLVGGSGSKPRGGILCADSSWSILDKELETISTRKFDPFYLSEEDKQTFLNEVKPYWQGKSMLEMWRAQAPEEISLLRHNRMDYIGKKARRG